MVGVWVDVFFGVWGARALAGEFLFWGTKRAGVQFDLYANHSLWVTLERV